MRVLVIEDNHILWRNLVQFLASEDIFAQLAVDGKDGLYQALTKFYDIILLDIHLPEKNGKEICQEIRNRGKQTGIIMLTSLGTQQDIIDGLDLWADDYLVKPVDYKEMLARMHAVNRRKNANRSNTIIHIKDIEINLQKHEIRKNKQEISLSKLEYNLFLYLAKNKGTALTRQDIYEKVWGEYDGDFLFSKTIEVYIGYLRKKLGKEIIETKKGFWYLIP